MTTSATARPTWGHLPARSAWGSRGASNIADGTVISSIHRRHRAVEFKKFLIKIDKEVPADQILESIARLMKRTTGAGH